MLACLFCGALEAEEALDVEVGALLEAGPVGVLGVHRVEAELVDHHAVAEGLVPGVNPQGPGAPAKIKICHDTDIDNTFEHYDETVITPWVSPVKEL